MDRRLILLFVAFSLSCASLSAQLVQKGLALLQNSGKQPLAQVSLLVSGAAPATSDSRGQFNLHFATHKEGDQVRTIQIDKPGYELVNLKDVELWNLSATIPFVVVMCPKGALEESRRRYYKLGEDRYRRLYQEKLGELERALAEHNLQENIWPKWWTPTASCSVPWLGWSLSATALHASTGICWMSWTNRLWTS